MDCKKMLQELNLYIDGELENELCQQLEVHLKGCDQCRIVLDTTTKTIEFYRDQTPIEKALRTAVEFDELDCLPASAHTS